MRAHDELWTRLHILDGAFPRFLIWHWHRVQPAPLGYSTQTREKDPSHMRISGTVKFYNSTKGYGFIQPADGSKDVFVHATALERAGIRALNEGDKVTFVLEDDRKGRGKQAGQVQLDA